MATCFCERISPVVRVSGWGFFFWVFEWASECTFRFLKRYRDKGAYVVERDKGDGECAVKSPPWKQGRNEWYACSEEKERLDYQRDERKTKRAEDRYRFRWNGNTPNGDEPGWRTEYGGFKMEYIFSTSKRQGFGCTIDIISQSGNRKQRYIPTQNQAWHIHKKTMASNPKTNVEIVFFSWW